MFKYYLNPSQEKQTLFVELPDKLKFDYEFLKATTHLLFQINNLPCENVSFRCRPGSAYDKMCKAFIYILLSHIAQTKKAFWNPLLKASITSTVHTQKGKDFTPIDNLAKTINSTELNFYQFEGDIGTQVPINELTRLMVDLNITFNPIKTKDFLSTTIGEVFSNSIIHSEQETLFFMFDIVHEDDKYMLYVNIIDFGTTIVDNVKAFFERTKKIHISSEDCMRWAIKSGNTTKNSSGGYGLPLLIDYIQTVHGDLFIFSGNAYYRLEDGNVEVSELTDGFFAGTDVTFKVEILKTSSALVYDQSEGKLTYVSLENI